LSAKTEQALHSFV